MPGLGEKQRFRSINKMVVLSDNEASSNNQDCLYSQEWWECNTYSFFIRAIPKLNGMALSNFGIIHNNLTREIIILAPAIAI